MGVWCASSLRWQLNAKPLTGSMFVVVATLFNRRRHPYGPLGLKSLDQYHYRLGLNSLIGQTLDVNCGKRPSAKQVVFFKISPQGSEITRPPPFWSRPTADVAF